MGDMTYKEFNQWAHHTFGYRITNLGTNGPGRAIWGRSGINGAGMGYSATYGIIEQRRLATWLRCRRIVAKTALQDWLNAAEKHDTGWLINQGTGIWWTENPEIVAGDLLQTGFIAVRCGVDG